MSSTLDSFISDEDVITLTVSDEVLNTDNVILSSENVTDKKIVIIDISDMDDDDDKGTIIVAN